MRSACTGELVTFRIKVTDDLNNGATVYDNGTEQTLDGGDIQIPPNGSSGMRRAQGGAYGFEVTVVADSLSVGGHIEQLNAALRGVSLRPSEEGWGSRGGPWSRVACHVYAEL